MSQQKAESARSDTTAADGLGARPNGPAAFRYDGPKDVGRAESLYKMALTKPDLDYCVGLLFSALVANPEHEASFAAILARLPAYAAQGRRMVVRISEMLSGAPADTFVKTLAAYCAAPPDAELALSAAQEARKVGLLPYAVALGGRVLQQMETRDGTFKAALASRLIDLSEACGALEQAVAAARWAARAFPDDLTFREREKNLTASRYIEKTDLTSAPSFQKTLHERRKQEALHRPADHHARLDALEQRYRQSHSLEDFRELVRALREAYPNRREAALPTLQDGLERFGERDTRWFVREIQLERRWAELRLHKQVTDETPGNAGLLAEHERLRGEVLAEQIEHLYEVVSSMPNTPERHRRELELAQRLLEAGRFEEAVKQAQAVKRRGESRLDAWIVMAKAFVRIGLIPEAGECFEQILAELRAAPHGSIERVLEAKYSYAEFLLAQAADKRDGTLAAQARKLCSDVMIEDIDYREIRALSGRAEELVKRLG